MRRSSNRARLRAWALAAAATLAPTGALGDDEAEVLVQKGIELRKTQHDLEALDVFRLAYAKAPTPRILAQIGLAEHALGLWLGAETDLVGALAHASDPWIQKNGDALRAALEVVRGHLGWVLVEANVVGAELRVDGRFVGKLPLPRVRVVAGAGFVEVSAGGHESVSRAVVVPARGEVKVGLVLVAAPPPVERPLVVVEGPATRVPVRTSPWTKVGIGAMSVGVFSLGLGTFFVFRTLEHKHERDAHCSALGCDAEGLSADRAARFSSGLALTTLGVGLAATVGGLVVFLRGRSADVVVTSNAGPRHLGLAVGTTW